MIARSAAFLSIDSPGLAWLVLAMTGSEGASTATGVETDPSNMARLAGGDTRALRPIFDRWKLPLLSYFYRSLGSRADAEDLVLQTLSAVHRHANRYRPEASFSAWLFAIARRELLHELRRRRRRPLEPVAPADLECAAADLQAEQHAHAAELEEHLLEALQHLSERERSALLLCAAEDLSHREVAATLGVSENHLSVILHRARHALRAHLSSNP